MHSLKLKKEKYKELYAFRKEKKERRKKGKKKRDICVSHCRPGLTRKEFKRKEGKKEERKEEKDCREKHLFLRLSAVVI